MMIKMISSSFPSNVVTERDLDQTDSRLNQQERIKLTHYNLHHGETDNQHLTYPDGAEGSVRAP